MAFWDTLLVAISTFTLILLTAPFAKTAAWLLLPYLLRACIASYLAWAIYNLNKKA